MRLAPKPFVPATLAALAALLGLVTREARAQETPPPPAPPVAVTPPVRDKPRVMDEPRERVETRTESRDTPESEERGLAFRADMKLPFTVSNSFTSSNGASFISSNPFAPVPQLTLGLQYKRLGFGLGFGFMNFGYSIPATNNGGGIFGTSASSYSLTELMIAPTVTYDLFQSNDHRVALYALGAALFGDIIETNQDSLTDLGFQFAVGANVALHENFRVGLEVGPVGHFYNGGPNNETLTTVSVYTALVGTFVYPR